MSNAAFVLKRATTAIAIACFACSCASGNDAPSEPISVQATLLSPSTWIAGTSIQLSLSQSGQAPARSIELSGELDGTPVSFSDRIDSSNDAPVYVWPGAAFAFGKETGRFVGTLVVHALNSRGEVLASSSAQNLDVELREALTPLITDASVAQALHWNDEIAISGNGFLLGGAEGNTELIFSGCFRRKDRTDCQSVDDKIVVASSVNMDRTSLVARFAPTIANTVGPGAFVGTFYVVNNHSVSGQYLESTSTDLSLIVIEPEIISVTPTGASLGQFVDIRGGGFVGDETSSSEFMTTLQLRGVATVLPDGSEVRIDAQLVPEFRDGTLLRYVLSEEDAIGRLIDLRKQRAQFVGTVQPILVSATETFVGAAKDLEFDILPVKQVVQIEYVSTFDDVLREFGLRGLSAAIADRIMVVLRRDYEGINIEFRTDAVDDFAQYSVAELLGFDPAGSDTLGLDNTPGKDADNQRLHDRIGGANSVMQGDEHPGYGGVFLRSFFAFSKHPGSFATQSTLADPLFDEVFDQFRPDRGGVVVSSADLADYVPLTNGDACPASSRKAQVACAAFVLGNLVGSTLSHEIGHSLGLANPTDKSAAHNPFDTPNGLMDRGEFRPFAERAELLGQGPSQFCVENFAYLRRILASDGEVPATLRPDCR